MRKASRLIGRAVLPLAIAGVVMVSACTDNPLTAPDDAGAPLLDETPPDTSTIDDGQQGLGGN